MSSLTRYTKRTFVREVLVIAAALLLLLPFYLLVVMAFKDTVEAATSSPVAPPLVPTLQNFFDVLDMSDRRNVVSGILNSVIITVGSVLCLIGIGSIAAYVLSRRSGKLSSIAYVFFLLGVILPFQLGMIPTYIFFRSVHLLGTHVGMILLYAGLLMPLAVFIYVGFARSIPREYEEAAAIDGATRFQTFRLIVFPLLSPATGTVVILTGAVIWNDFMVPLIFLSGSDAGTLPVMIYGFVGENVSRWNQIFAVVIVSIVPALVAFLLAQRKFIQGFAGGIKG